MQNYISGYRDNGKNGLNNLKRNKMETLEESFEKWAEQQFEKGIGYDKLDVLRFGAKWQQENILQLLKDNDYQDEAVFELLTEQFKNK